MGSNQTMDLTDSIFLADGTVKVNKHVRDCVSCDLGKSMQNHVNNFHLSELHFKKIEKLHGGFFIAKSLLSQLQIIQV